LIRRFVEELVEKEGEVMTKDEWVAKIYRILRESLGPPNIKAAMNIAEEIAQEQEEDYGDGVIKSLPWEVIPTEEGGDDEND